MWVVVYRSSGMWGVAYRGMWGCCVQEEFAQR